MSEGLQKSVTLRCDGACISNPSPMTGVGMALYEGGDAVKMWGATPDAQTNNEAEYASVINGLKVALEMGYAHITVLNDNQMVVKQITVEWNTHSKTLKPFLNEATELLERFESWEIRWVPREKNEMVDAIAKEQVKIAQRQRTPWAGAI